MEPYLGRISCLKYIVDLNLTMCNKHLDVVVSKSGEVPLERISKDLDNLYTYQISSFNWHY